MRAGSTRSYVTIEEPITVTNAYGEETTTWATWKKAWGQILPISGKEFYSANQKQSEITHKIRIRFISGLNTEMRINYKGRIFDMESVLNFQERGFWHEIMAIENV